MSEKTSANDSIAASDATPTKSRRSPWYLAGRLSVEVGDRKKKRRRRRREEKTVRLLGLEPRTYGLKVRCSTN